MYNKHYEVEEEAYKLLRECVGVNLTPELINKIANIRKDLNTRYKNEYYVEFPPLVMPTNAFVVQVRVHTVH
ncbi:hypothetical protein AVV36_gp210 [Pectobacterium bacteriophage PM2]|uniref:Uncharacterized protein n=1 Tax=Pectobacterium bacteriophage PM2 TaxID=1429794 RepID=A0A0A0Q2H4_9CAUD|nr:hypothetical protein AVV36_gp210 [Pectobacterium bacteriophage PM2]AHY25200.1 hypothetical protein PM2_238 [Pectobacterium bacteriophage PM2]